jgi:outer membrane protein TolC
LLLRLPSFMLMNRFVFLFLISAALSLRASAQKDLQFSNLDSLISYADKNSAVSRTGSEQVILARYQKIAALVNVVNIRSPLSFNLTNNTTLPVSYIPGELLGGKPGTFKEITLGQEYVGNLSYVPQIDLINAGAWSRIRGAGLNQELTNEMNLINKKTLFESIAACYYNILSLQEQVKISGDNLSASDTLLMIVSDKYAQGLVRHQDVNDASVNKINLADRKKQLELNLEQQWSSLKILCDIPQAINISFTGQLNYQITLNAGITVNSQLLFKSAVLQTEIAKADLRTNRLANLPVISLIYSHSYYQNSNDRFFDNSPNNKWLTSVYFGAKITLPLPDVSQVVQASNSKINYKISEINREHSKLQNESSNIQLQLDFDKAVSQFNAAKQVFRLKEENYKMAGDQYKQSVLPFDKYLLSFSDMLTSRLNYSSALANLLFTKSKIDINNQIK